MQLMFDTRAAGTSRIRRHEPVLHIDHERGSLLGP